jgi:hypothetical protein
MSSMQQAQQPSVAPPAGFSPVPWALGGVWALLGIVAGFRLSDMGASMAPTFFDLAAVVWACCAAIFVDWWSRRPTLQPTPWLAAVLGSALGVATCYCVCWLPLALLGAFAILVFGIGLLVLAPFFNLLGLVILVRRVSRRIRERASSSALRRYQVVLAASFCVFPSTVVFREYRAARVDAAMLRIDAEAGGGSGPFAPVMEARIEERMVRELDPKAMLRLAYGRSPSPVTPGGFLRVVMRPRHFVDAPSRALQVVARRAYFRASGRPFWLDPLPPQAPTEVFESASPPFALPDGPGFEESTDFDLPGGAGAENGPRRGLAIRASELRLQASEEPGVVRASWAFEVGNESRWPRQTRMQFALPPDAVAAGLHLEVEGVERPAAFALDDAAVRAYERVSGINAPRPQRTGRDPALLREPAPRRARLVVFPVPGDGVARFRVAFELPVRERPSGEVFVPLPTLFDRDTHWPARVSHRIVAATELVETGGDGARRIPWRADHDDDGLVTVMMPPDVTADAVRHAVELSRAWIEVFAVPGDVVEVPGDVVAGEPQAAAWPLAVARPLVVVDAYHGHGALLEPEFVESLPADTAALVLREDGDVPSESAGSTLLAAARAAPFLAPRDALERTARALASRLGAGERLDVLWVHAASTYDMPRAESVRRLANALAKSGSRLVALPARADLTPNKLVEELDRERGLVRVHRSEQTLAAELRALRAGRALVATPANALAERSAEDPEIARLQPLRRLTALRTTANDPAEIAELALAERFVTASTSAVVLETDEQYEQHGLVAPDPRDPPAGGEPVPEPATWLLLGSALAILFAVTRTRGRTLAA